MTTTTTKEYIEAGIKIIHAKDSQFFKEHDHGRGFVAVTKAGSEYFGSTKNQAMQTIIRSRGAEVIGEWDD